MKTLKIVKPAIVAAAVALTAGPSFAIGLLPGDAALDAESRGVAKVDEVKAGATATKSTSKSFDVVTADPRLGVVGG